MKKILLAFLLGTINLSANAYTVYEAPSNNPHFNYFVFNAGEPVVMQGEDSHKVSLYNMTNNQLMALFYSAKKWSEYLKFTPNTLPAYIVYTSKELNASA